MTQQDTCDYCRQQFATNAYGDVLGLQGCYNEFRKHPELKIVCYDCYEELKQADQDEEF